MDKEKTGDPKDGEQHDSGPRYGFLGPTTTSFVPRPMTSGPPQPEPEERWTLAPVRRTEPPAGAGDEPAPEGAPVEPVNARVTRPAAGGGEPDRT